MDFSPNRAVLGRGLMVFGVAGAITSLVAMVVALRIIGDLGSTTRAGAGTAGEAIVLVERTLADTEATTRELSTVFSDAEVLLDGAADLSEDDIAGSLEAVEDAMPALIEVAAVIDGTLSTLNALPFGPDYNPEEPFDASLRRVEQELDGVPDSLREQAVLIRDAGSSLADVRAGTVAVADDLAELQVTLADAADLLGAPTDTDAQHRLGERLRLARILAVALGLTATGAYAVAAASGRLMLVAGRSDP